jgi:hypothetical protein
VVLTDDGALQHRISNPRHKLPRATGCRWKANRTTRP